MLGLMSLIRRDSTQSIISCTIRTAIPSMPDLESGEAHSSATAQDFVKEKPGSGKKGDPPALGFPGLAKQIAQDPDQETFVFRKFNRLTAWSLVFTENELASLEDKLGRLEDAMLGDRIAMRSAKDWAQFETRAKDESTTEYKIMDLTHKISAKLAQYRTSHPCLQQRHTDKTQMKHSLQQATSPISRSQALASSTCSVT